MEHKSRGLSSSGDSITLGKNTKVIGPVAIGPGTIIGDNVLIGPYTRLATSALSGIMCGFFIVSLQPGVIGTNSTISGCIMDNDTHIGEPAVSRMIRS